MRNGQASRYLEKARKRRETKPSPISDEAAQASGGAGETNKKGGAFEGAKAVSEGWHPEEREHHRQERSYWRLSALLTFFAVLGAIATVILSQCSLQEARNATKEAHRQAEEAKRQADIAQRAFVEAERPIIDIVANKLDFTGENHSGHPNIDFQIANIGNKPAFVWLAISQITLTDEAPPANDSFDIKASCDSVLGDRTIGVGMAINTSCHLFRPLTETQRTRLLEKSMQMYFHGIVKYRSPSGINWIKGFEYYWQPPMQGRRDLLDALLNATANFDRENKPKEDK